MSLNGKMYLICLDILICQVYDESQGSFKLKYLIQVNITEFLQIICGSYTSSIET